MASKFCTHCGESLQPGASYCTKCGTKIGAGKSPLKIILILVIACLIVVGIISYLTPVRTRVNQNQNNTAEIKYNVYQEKNHLYSIEYPADWKPEQPKANAVIFSGKKGTPSFYSVVTIEVVAAKKQGGKYSSTQQAVNNLKDQIIQSATDVTILEEGEAKITANLKGFHGQYFLATYTYKGIPVKNVQFIIGKDDKVFYSWGYTSTVTQYDTDLPLAKAMYESWSINPLQR